MGNVRGRCLASKDCVSPDLVGDFYSRRVNGNSGSDGQGRPEGQLAATNESNMPRLTTFAKSSAKSLASPQRTHAAEIRAMLQAARSPPLPLAFLPRVATVVKLGRRKVVDFALAGPPNTNFVFVHAPGARKARTCNRSASLARFLRRKLQGRLSEIPTLSISMIIFISQDEALHVETDVIVRLLAVSEIADPQPGSIMFP